MPLSGNEGSHTLNGLTVEGGLDVDSVNVTGNADIANPRDTYSLQVTPTGAAGSSTTTGGAVRIVNTSNTGIGLLVYSNSSSPTGRLCVVKAANASFNQSALRVEHAGSGRGLDVDQTGTGIGANIAGAGGATASAHALAVSLTNDGSTTSCAGSFASANTAHSALQVTGVESGRGTIKVAHTGTGADGNASGLSIDLQGSGTAAQGIFVDASEGGTTGKLIQLKNAGGFRFDVLADGTLVLLNASTIRTGANTPEGAVTANVGSLFLRTDGSTSTTLYVKTSGSGNTGWTAK